MQAKSHPDIEAATEPIGWLLVGHSAVLATSPWEAIQMSLMGWAPHHVLSLKSNWINQSGTTRRHGIMDHGPEAIC